MHRKHSGHFVFRGKRNFWSYFQLLFFCLLLTVPALYVPAFLYGFVVLGLQTVDLFSFGTIIFCVSKKVCWLLLLRFICIICLLFFLFSLNFNIKFSRSSLGLYLLLVKRWIFFSFVFYTSSFITRLFHLLYSLFYSHLLFPSSIPHPLCPTSFSYCILSV